MTYPRNLGGDVFVFQSPLWQTNTLVAFAGREALVCDPALSPEEIRRVRESVEAASPTAVHFLVTHADFDHVCAIPDFPDAEVIAGRESAERIEDGIAAEGLRSQGPQWGMAWRDELRVDRVLEPGEAECGAFRVEVLEAPSHGREGVAYVLLDQGVLLPGDHVSAITYPLLGGAIERERRANETLLVALDRHELRWVVPGHGPPLEPAEARRILEEDLAYLEGLEAAAREAVSERLAPGWALLRAYAVEPPRPTTPDFEIYNVRAGNAQKVLEQVSDREESDP